MQEALYYEKQPDGAVKCRLCPRGCTIAPGRAGFCLGRYNQDGRLVARNYALTTSIAMDPIEKKPLYHFAPGSVILSAGTYGCNLGCIFCQNSEISRRAPPEAFTRQVPPEQMVQLALEHDSIGIAYTYNEPLIWYEYVLDTAQLARRHGLANVLVTNGYVNPQPLQRLLPFIDAMNIDVKAYNDRFYPELCAGRLEPVLETAQRSVAAGVLVETTTLIIPRWNDAPAELEALAKWMRDNLGPDTPAHVSAYRPAYKMKEPPTPLRTLLAAHEAMKRHLHYVYVGNVATDVGSDTVCKACGALLVQRRGYHVRLGQVGANLRCAACGADNHLIPFKKPSGTTDN